MKRMIDRNPWPSIVAGCLGFWLLVGGCVAYGQAPDFKSGIVLWPKCNEASGSACIDSTGLHPNGTYAGSWTTTAAPVQFGSVEVARVGDGATNDVTIADANDLESNRAMAILAWLKTSTGGSNLFYYAKSNAGFTSGDEAGIVSGSPAFVGRPVGVNSQPGSPDFNDGLWHHIAITSTDVGGGFVVIRIYIDGVLVFTSTSIAWTPTANSDPVRLFSRRGAAWWPGAIYDLRRYNRTLVAADVAAAFRWPATVRKVQLLSF